MVTSPRRQYKPIPRSWFVLAGGCFLLLSWLLPEQSPASEPETSSARVTVMHKRVRKDDAAPQRLDDTVDGLLDRLPELLHENPVPLLEVVHTVETFQQRFVDQILRLRSLQEQALEAKDTVLFLCLHSREERARQLADAADDAYDNLLRDIANEDVDGIAKSLALVALFPDLEQRFVEGKDECMGTLSGTYVDHLDSP